MGTRNRDNVLTDLEYAFVSDLRQCLNREIATAGILTVLGTAIFKFYGARKTSTLPPLKPRDFGILVGNFFVLSIIGSPLCVNHALKRHKLRKDEAGVFDNDKSVLSENLNTDLNFNEEPKMETFESNFSHLHLDLDSNSFNDNVTELTIEPEEKPKPKPTVTYEELRKRNRQNFARSYYSGTPIIQPPQPETRQKQEKDKRQNLFSINFNKPTMVAPKEESKEEFSLEN